jgi:hypothetical protein
VWPAEPYLRKMPANQWNSVMEVMLEVAHAGLAALQGFA